MATLTVRDLPDDVRDRLRVRAAKHGRSMEAEVRAIITANVARPEGQDAFLARVAKAQAAFSGLEASPRLASDELLAERKLEAWREDAETKNWIREHGGKAT